MITKNYTKRIIPPSDETIVLELKRYLNNFSKTRDGWQEYKWFFATQTCQDMPVGEAGSFIIIAGSIPWPRTGQPKQGWFYVASSASRRELYKWRHWKDCVGVQWNTTIRKRKISAVERKLGRDPDLWVKHQSSSNPDDWIVPNEGVKKSRYGNFKKRHSEIMEKLANNWQWSEIQEHYSLSNQVTWNHKRLVAQEINEKHLTQQET